MSRKSKAGWYFLIIVIIFACISIGYDYFYLSLINYSPRYTIGKVTRYYNHIRGYDKIDYTYQVNDREYHGRYYSNDVYQALQDHRIIVKYSSLIKGFSCPYNLQIVVDTLDPPADGWIKLPEIITSYTGK